jgi:hypothetical protein
MSIAVFAVNADKGIKDKKMVTSFSQCNVIGGNYAKLYVV